MFKFSNHYILLIFCLVFNKLPAQEQNNSVSDFISYLRQGTYETFHDPANRWILGAAAIGTMAAFKVDDDLQKHAQNDGLLNEDLSHFGDLYGGGWGHWVLLCALGADAAINSDSKISSRSKLKYALVSLGVNGFVTQTLKLGVGRERPNGNGTQSFPSGHTSHSFAIAAVTHEIFGTGAGLSAYAVAGLVAASRINDNKHYLSDVIFGAGLGTVIGRGFAYSYRQNNTALSLIPALNGITAVYIF